MPKEAILFTKRLQLDHILVDYRQPSPETLEAVKALYKPRAPYFGLPKIAELLEVNDIEVSEYIGHGRDGFPTGREVVTYHKQTILEKLLNIK